MHFTVWQILMKCLNLEISTISYFDQEYFTTPRSKGFFSEFFIPFKDKTPDLKVYKLWLFALTQNGKDLTVKVAPLSMGWTRCCFQPALVLDSAKVNIKVNTQMYVALNGNAHFCSSLLLVSGRQQVKGHYALLAFSYQPADICFSVSVLSKEVWACSAFKCEQTTRTEKGELNKRKHLQYPLERQAFRCQTALSFQELVVKDASPCMLGSGLF